MKNFALLISFIIILESASSEDPYRSAKIRRKFGTMKERDDFVQWRQKHKKRYRTLDDETEASEKWLENYDRIQKHNKAFKEGKVAFKQGLWEYSDLSDDEKENTLLGLKAPPVNRNAPIPAELPQFPIGPMFINWTAEGLTSPVGNQGNCGSCWAWSALGVIDSVIRRKMINLTVSAQQLVDCSKRFCWGCSSGWPKYALDYVQANGIASESSYPYFARNQNCTYDTSMSVTVSVLNKTYNIPTRGKEHDVLSEFRCMHLVSNSIFFYVNFQETRHGYGE